jgi:DNA invertase Pin-like site-specific DNA recombinase
MSKTILYVIGATQSDLDAEMAQIRPASWLGLDPNRGDKAYSAPPSELRNKPAMRRVFQRVVAELQPYDTLVVTQLNRLGRTVAEGLETRKLLEWRKVHLRCLELGDHRAVLTQVDLGRVSEHGALIARTMAACEKLEREERDRRRNARTKTKRQGRPPALSPNKRREALDRLATPDVTVTRVAKVMGVSRATIYRALKLAAVEPPPRAHART